MNFMVGALLQLCNCSRVHAFWHFLLFHRSLDYRLLHEGTMPLLTARTRQLDILLEQVPSVALRVCSICLFFNNFVSPWLLLLL